MAEGEAAGVSTIGVSDIAGGMSRRADHRGVRRLNNVLAVFLVAFLAVVPLPLGSNRPVFWALSALAIAVAALVYSLRVGSLGANLRFPATRLRFAGVLFGLFLIVLLVQILPLGPVTFIGGNGANLVSSSYTSAPGETVLMLLRQLGYGLFFFLTLQVGVNRQRAERILKAIFVVVLAHAVFAMIALTQLGDSLLFFEKTAYFGVATGTFVNRNSFATFLAMGTICGAAILFSEMTKSRSGAAVFGAERRLRQAAYLVAIVIVGGTLVATRSRMGIVSLAAGLSVAGLFAASVARVRLVRLAGWFVVGGMVLAAAAAFLFGGGVLDRLGSTESDLDVRTSLYAQVWEMITSRPFLGFGGGSFELAYPLFHSLPVSPDLIWDKTHSTYLALWVELGLVFGSVPLIILAFLALRLWRQRSVDGARSVGVITALGALAVVAVHSLLDFSLEIQANTYLFLALMALGVAERPSRRRERGAE